MPKRNAALDTSFWINAFEAGITEFLSDYFLIFSSARPSSRR